MKKFSRKVKSKTSPFTGRTFYYDIETDHQFAPYAKLDLIGILWDDDTVEVHKWPLEQKEFVRLQKLFADPEIKKVGFNCCNFDDIVLRRFDMPVEETNRHDAYLAIKTLRPELPAFSLKFLNWLLFGDFHWPEYKLEVSQAVKKIKSKFIDADEKLLTDYNIHDLIQHKRLWEWIEPQLKDRSLDAYNLDRSQGKVIEQMILDGGLYIDREKCEKLIRVLEHARKNNLEMAQRKSGGKVTNAGSTQQVGAYFDAEGFELELTDKGALKVDKSLLENLWRLNPVAKCVKNIRKIDSMLKYYRNYLEAINDPTYADRPNWIPTSYSISSAITRRYTSSSMYKLNFQNPNEAAKRVQIVPKGWLAWWFDATQIENIVHIYLTKDKARREAYEADENWSEYVWLCNTILGTNKTKKELDSMVSPVNENWSVYKQYKTIKLMMNFGAGVKKFAMTTGFPEKVAKKLFEDIHRACPAIRQLQQWVQEQLEEYGEVYDVFGHVYRGKPEMAYKIVAYLVQGCGTGSLPKAQNRANYETLQKYNSLYGRKVGTLAVTTHDECGGYLDLSIGEEAIEKILSEIHYNMTAKFSPKFDNIPLRSKMYLSTTNAVDRKEVKSYAEFLKIQNEKT